MFSTGPQTPRSRMAPKRERGSKRTHPGGRRLVIDPKGAFFSWNHRNDVSRRDSH